ncbi:retropepsin-like aspartic protease family protein [Tsuneonella sp. HG222]
MKTLVAAVLLTGAAIGWLGPDFSAPSEVVAPHKLDTPASTEPATPKAPQWYGGAMVLQREEDGHFYAQVRIDTRDYRMLVDTGASMVALTGEDARDLGLDWNPDKLEPVARGAGGIVYGVPIVLPEVAVGDYAVKNVEAVIIPEGLPFSLLGQSFLSHIATVQMSGPTLTLGG